MRDDLKLLQGTWTITSLKMDGQEMPDTMLAEAQVAVKGDRFTSTGMGAVYEGRLTLDAAAHPPQIDMKFDAGPEKGNTNLGIYKIDSDKWKLCLATRGSVRPTRFAATPGSGFVLETLMRGSVQATPAAKAKPAQTKKPAGSGSRAPATELEGDWQMVSCVTDGAPMEQSAVQWVKRSTIGNEVSVHAGAKVIMKMTFTHDPTKSPKTIDYVHTAGANKGKNQLGIYELQDDVLKICVGPANGARSAKFDSLRGEGATFTVWKRIKMGS